jgi:hypothetical protein
LPTTASVNDYQAWVAEQLIAGTIKTGQARELTAGARTILMSIRTAHGLDEMSKLEDLVRRAEEAAQQRKKNAVDSRFAQGGQRFGRTAVDETPKGNA